MFDSTIKTQFKKWEKKGFPRPKNHWEVPVENNVTVNVKLLESTPSLKILQKNRHQHPLATAGFTSYHNKHFD